MDKVNEANSADYLKKGLLCPQKVNKGIKQCGEGLIWGFAPGHRAGLLNDSH